MEFIDREAGTAILLLFRKIAHQWGVGGERQKILKEDDYLLIPAELVDEPLVSIGGKGLVTLPENCVGWFLLTNCTAPRQNNK